MTPAPLEEIVPQLPDNLQERQAVLDKAREIVLAHWRLDSDPVLAMALQVLVQIPGSLVPALAALDGLHQAVEQSAALAA